MPRRCAQLVEIEIEDECEIGAPEIRFGARLSTDRANGGGRKRGGACGTGQITAGRPTQPVSDMCQITFIGANERARGSTL